MVPEYQRSLIMEYVDREFIALEIQVGSGKTQVQDVWRDKIERRMEPDLFYILSNVKNFIQEGDKYKFEQAFRSILR